MVGRVRLDGEDRHAREADHVQRGLVGLLRRAVVAVDFSEYCRDAAATLLEILGDDAEVRLVHISWIRAGDGVDGKS